jgi:hypothetical protein
MSRITGSDAFNLIEAYNAVYAPQELTEEQVWEEVENWVNSLVEEGYDLSEYTWEDMYEAYIEEQGARRGAAPATSTTSGAVTTYAQPRPNTGQSYQSRFARPMNAGTPVSQGARRGAAPSRVTRPQIGSLPTNYRGSELQQSAAARASQVGTTRQGTAGGPTVGGNTPIGTTRPVAPAPAAPAAPVTPRPVAQAPTVRPTSAAAPAAASQSQKPTTTPTATPAASRQKDTSITDMIGRSQIRQGAPINTGNASSDIRSMALRGSSSGSGAAPVATPKPSVQQQIRQRRLNMDLDLFDIVKGYLIDEGYAETEEAAAVIMVNMSEEWKTQIIESGYFPTKESQREDEAKYKKGGSEVKHRDIATQSPKPSR